MSLNPGVRVGAFEILTLLGSGGMGEVYRARDTKLNRDVAIKPCPSTWPPILRQDQGPFGRHGESARLRSRQSTRVGSDNGGDGTHHAVALDVVRAYAAAQEAASNGKFDAALRNA
jgi:hypothetical protein